jgi:D-3-phosphoglycerate dehydrogenase
LARLPKLRIISQTGKVGPHIDVEACSRRGVAVAEGTGYSAATAEFTWLLILAAMRRLPAYMANLYAGAWQQSVPARPDWPLAGLGVALAGKTLGVWSYGKIGALVAGYGKAFGMTVLVHGSEQARARAQADGHSTTPSRDELFERADVLTLHLRLAERTRGCVTRQDLARMQPAALLVNTSRAELVETGALVEALERGRPGMAAVSRCCGCRTSSPRRTSASWSARPTRRCSAARSTMSSPSPTAGRATSSTPLSWPPGSRASATGRAMGGAARCDVTRPR